MECPICMDDIQACNVNCVTTECGHQFHTSCLMRNIAHNGFGCPYCRNVMAEEVEDSDDDEYTEIDDEETIVSEVSYDSVTQHDEVALSGMRRLFRSAQNDIEDAVEDDDDDQEDIIKLTSQQITDSFVKANFTMTDIVRAFMITNGYYSNEDETENEMDEFMQKIEDHFIHLQTAEIPTLSVEIAESKSSISRVEEECLGESLL